MKALRARPETLFKFKFNEGMRNLGFTATAESISNGSETVLVLDI